MGKLTSEEEIRALLQRYKCPVPFHQVRAHVLGNILSPVGAATPLALLKRLWGGTLPAIVSRQNRTRLIHAFMTGLWTPLRKQQEPAFHLVRVESKPTRGGLTAVALTRCQEIDGFVDGLFPDTEEEVDFPERAEDGLRELARMRGALAEVADNVATWRISGSRNNVDASLRLLRALTERAEQEIQAIVVSCAGARQSSAAALPAPRPTVH